MSAEVTISEVPSALDRDIVTRQLGRRPRCDFRIAARHPVSGEPTVIENPPFLFDGTPMPTRYWLVDETLSRRIGTLEAAGGVKGAEADIDPEVLSATHRRYEGDRDALIAADHTGPRPSGGVGGTRQGVKCLHTHYAWFLAGGDDPVGAWVHERLTLECS